MVTEEVNAYSTKLLKIFGYNVRRVRERNRFSFSDVERRSGYSRRYISALERGEKDVQLSTAIRLARALNVPPAMLFTRTLDSGAAPQEAFTEDDFLLVFSVNVRRCLTAANKKEIHIYMETGLDTAAINRTLNMRTADPRISTLAKIAAGIGVDLSDLLSRAKGG